MLNLKGKHLISVHDWSTEEVLQVLKTAEMLKMCSKAGKEMKLLEGKALGMIFTKPSTRTRVSFEVAIHQLGGYALYLSASDLQLGRGETIADTARVLSRYLDGIMIRTYSHSDVVELARHASIPVINGLTDLLHPCQALTDVFTIYEKKGKLEGLTLAFVGDGDNVAHSLMFACAKVGINVRVATPRGYEPDPEIVSAAKADARAFGSEVTVLEDPVEAVKGADVLYTDVWVSMGKEAEKEERRKAFAAYQVNSSLMEAAKPDAIFMHCLPAHRGDEVTDDVIDGPKSVVWDEAENRLHVQKAILALVM
ncbi:MAG TPA: ornithine carbamoyltransferase [Clostridia bacterium]|nr:ornithine carbamoyltransferase [Clostridia bacterium]